MSKKPLPSWRIAKALAPLLLLTLVLTVGITQVASAQTFDVLYGFTGGADGYWPQGNLVEDASGNLYGVTRVGGKYQIDSGGNENSYGTVFKIAPNGSVTTLHTFAGGAGGSMPWGIVLDATGNLYGVTAWGGDMSCWGGTGCGVLYKIDTGGHYSVVYNFEACSDGAQPFSLTADGNGNIYGVTSFGGNNQCSIDGGFGTIFKVDASGHESVLYSFTGGSDGQNPQNNLILDSSGNLYGASWNTAFKFNTTTLAFTLLHSFSGGLDGRLPKGTTLDSAGNLYGNTYLGGLTGYGLVYKIDANHNYSVLYNFRGGSDGGYPLGNIARDSSGNIYGAAFAGGASQSYFGCESSGGCGVVFKVSPSGQETVLYSFTGFGDGGGGQGVLLDSSNHIYGYTTKLGTFLGQNGTTNDAYGTIYEVTQ